MSKRCLYLAGFSFVVYLLTCKSIRLSECVLRVVQEKVNIYLVFI